MFRDGAERILFAAAATLLFLAVAMMTAQVTLRSFFAAPMSWAEEVVRYAFVWCVYLGAVIAVIKDTHIRVTVAIDIFGARGRMISNFASRIINIVCFAYLAWWGFDLAMKYRFAEFYTLPGVPQLIFYASLPFCAGLIVFFLCFPGAIGRDAGGERND